MPGALPPGPSGTLRSTYRVLETPFASLPAWQRRYGDPFTIPTVNGTVVMTGDPQLVRAIFGAAPGTFTPWATDAVAPILGPGSVLILGGERHLRERKLLMPSFHGDRMRAYGDIIARTARRHLLAASSSSRVIALELAQTISLEVITRAVFGAQDDATADALARAVLDMIGASSPLLFFMPFLQRDFGGLGPWARFRRAHAHLDTLLQARIEQARASAGEDICSLMVAARYEDGSPMRDEDIRDELRTLLFAGHETTAITIAWLFDFIHRDPACLARLRDEISALGPDPDPTAIAGLAYLDAVCKEGLRVYPVVTEVLRMVHQPFTLGELEIQPGHAVSAGILLVHRREELYPDPLVFRPERFLERRFSPFEYLPFGGGNRRCLGAAFASYEMAIVLGTALAHHRIELLDDRVPQPVRRNVTMAPRRGVPLRLHTPA